MPTSPLITAVVLLLNGVQIGLPNPALLVNGVGCVPVRPVVERLGGSVAYRSGEGIEVQLGGSTLTFTLAGGAAPPGPDRAVTIQGALYVSGRDLATATGGICRWRPELRALDLSIPPPPRRSGALGMAHPARAFADRGRVLALRSRTADRSADLLSPISASTGFPPGSVRVDSLDSVTNCIIQDITLQGGLSTPISGRGRQLELEGRWEFQGSDAPVFLAWSDASGDRGASADVAEISTHRRLYVQTEEVAFLLRRSGQRPPQGWSLAVSDPSGEAKQVGVADEIWSRAEIGGGGTVWSGHLGFDLPADGGRRSMGLWSASLVDANGRVECRCWFLVAPGSSGGVIQVGQ